MISKTCCFTGHREIPKNETNIIKQKLVKNIKYLCSKGVIYYGAGGARGFDTLAANAVLDLKTSIPEIRLILILPCKNHTRKWNKTDKQKHKRVFEQADKIVYITQEYYSGCMMQRNRYLIDNSSYCLCYMNGQKGGTMQTVAYAMEKNHKIINLSTEIVL